MTTSNDTLQRLRDLIQSDRFGPQSRLPPERDLAQELGVTRTTLRGALAALEAEGAIWRHVGRGTFVGSRPEPANDDQSEAGFVIDATNPQEVMEVRLILEPRIAALAALRASPAEIARMEECLRGATTATDVPSFEKWDSALHHAIAQAARNQLLLNLFRAVDAVREQEIWGRLKKATVTEDRKALYMSQHADCVQAVRDRDVAGAERHMRKHLETVRDNMLGTVV